MYLLLGADDYEGPQMIGAYSSVEEIQKAINKKYPDSIIEEHTKCMYVRETIKKTIIADFNYYEVELDNPILRISGSE